MNAENNFAARLIDAGRLAAIARTCGLKADVSYYVNEALKELWRTRSSEEAKKIAARWVLWDADGRPWPRMPPLENVVSFHRTAAAPVVNSPATPLQLIRDWFEKQDEEMRREIAGMAMLLVLEFRGPPENGSRERCGYLRRWLSQAGLPNHTVIGRALTFRTCFEYFAESRFTESGWTRSERAAFKILEDAKRDPNSETAHLAPIAKKMLDALPARKSRWIEVRKSWKQLAGTSLTPRALRIWSALHMERGRRDSSREV
ncbi:MULTISPECIES: hypothetical protein [Bradyrhizobium]|jgi:hypothetical protein|uniref:Integrase n=1 Tax=Bradyrhizobium elkanii TaxID=29448 RepID=A0ABV4EU79_BRAEL|nr:MULTISPECIES: hypothetical protein [Bradyrhizobium]MCP1755731.1 hypothetical protein [Bradyrhizobium elkanii]MCP1929407.1 hypothetical protein [Bradyrhizobium elkanii]MCP1981246.1 hypothetical protein [Bradyrhizobium elkanii]MCS3473273.1 hypothetical protein [Bradyrhizobium elkanii]MCS3579980.1 hypothetical protein [Bradyrhizobium elkanii]